MYIVLYISHNILPPSTIITNIFEKYNISRDRFSTGLHDNVHLHYISTRVQPIDGLDLLNLRGTIGCQRPTASSSSSSSSRARAFSLRILKFLWLLRRDFRRPIVLARRKRVYGGTGWKRGDRFESMKIFIPEIFLGITARLSCVYINLVLDASLSLFLSRLLVLGEFPAETPE